MQQKLYVRNIQYKNEEVEQVLKTNNKFVIDIGYLILFNRRMDKKLLDNYYKYNEKIKNSCIKNI